jgi:hypothetical protein
MDWQIIPPLQGEQPVEQVHAEAEEVDLQEPVVIQTTEIREALHLLMEVSVVTRKMAALEDSVVVVARSMKEEEEEGTAAVES